MNESIPQRRVQRVRHELVRRDLQVHAVRMISPQLKAITLAGPALAGFVSASFDDHLKLMIEGPDGQPVRRDYTPAHFDAERLELTIEFALHGHGQASEWARHAQVGDAATIGGPRGSMIIPVDYDWHLLAGDLSALPAITRRLRELPASTQALVLLLTDQADARPMVSQATLTVQHVSTPAAFLSSLQALTLPAGEGFAWCAGEAQLMAQARDLLARHHRLPKEAMRVAAYWKQGTES